MNEINGIIFFALVTTTDLVTLSIFLIKLLTGWRRHKASEQDRRRESDAEGGPVQPHLWSGAHAMSVADGSLRRVRRITTPPGDDNNGARVRASRLDARSSLDRITVIHSTPIDRREEESFRGSGDGDSEHEIAFGSHIPDASTIYGVATQQPIGGRVFQGPTLQGRDGGPGGQYIIGHGFSNLQPVGEERGPSPPAETHPAFRGAGAGAGAGELFRTPPQGPEPQDAGIGMI
jgi:hypothetical protein